MSADKILVKVWNCNRTKKIFLILEPNSTTDLYNTLILNASDKMAIDGSTLVLESDGTVIDDSEMITVLRNETFMLLEKHERWETVDVNRSTCSTVTVDSNFEDDLVHMGYQPPSKSPTIVENILSSTDMPRISEGTWINFKIPWDRVSEAAIADCETGKRNRNSYLEVIHATINSIRQQKLNISSKSLKVIAHKIISKYPAVFRDIDDDGVILGDGSHTVFMKLLDRNNYLNRAHKRSLSDISNSSIPISKKRKMLLAQAGCSNWQPLEPVESTETMDEKKEKLKDINIVSDWNEYTTSLLDDTYAIQRKFLNTPDPPSILEIKNEWPILLSENGIFWHYKKLMEQDINLLIENMQNKSNKIFRFGLEKKIINKYPDTSESVDAICLTVLKIFTSYFKEDLENLCRNLKNESELTDNVKTNAPSIISLYSGDEKQYYVVVEKQKINSGTNLFTSALKQMFAFYYNANMEYPKQITNTLEMVQRYFLKIHPDQGTKSKKSSKMKIISLMNKLKDL